MVPIAADADERLRRLALREARATGRLNHTNIVALYKVHEEPDAWLFEMEFVEGRTLADSLGPEGRLDPVDARRIATGVAEALRSAHAAGVVHGDVKPGNVLLRTDGAVKLADFGLARMVGEVSHSASGEGAIRGTPTHLAPEQTTGAAASEATDIWSFGVLLHRMLSGRLPFPAPNLPTLFEAIQRREPAPLDDRVPADLASLAFACLAKEPARRPRSFGEVLERLAPDAPRAPARSAGTRAAFFGRAPILRRLAEVLRRTEEGAGAALLVSGPIGIGKSALLRRLRGEVETRLRFVEAAVTPLEGLLRPLLRAARQALSGAGAEAGSAASASDVARRLLVAEGSLRVESRSESLWALDGILRALAGEAGVAVVIEDAQIANEEEARLLAGLVRRLPGEGISLVILERVEAGDGGRLAALGALGAVDGLERIELGPLDREDLYALVADRAGVERLSPPVSGRIVDLSQGNPLFAIELLQQMLASRAVVVEEGTLVPGARWDHEEFPVRLQELVRARIGSLGEADRACLDVAATDGVAFDGEAVSAALGEPAIQVLRRLHSIARRTGLVEVSGRGFRFANALFREAIVGNLAPEYRRAVHRALAEHLAARRDAPSIAPERLADHWEGAGEPERAEPCLLRAAREAAKRQEIRRAIDLARRAGLEAEGKPWPYLRERVEDLVHLGTTLVDAGHARDALRLFHALAEAARAAGDEAVRLTASLHRNEARAAVEGHASIDEEELRRVAALERPGQEATRACYLLGLAAKYAGHLEDAARWFSEANRKAIAAGIPTLQSASLDQLASVALRAGRHDEAEALYADAARIAAHSGRRTNAAVSTVNRVLSAFARGRIEGVAGELERALRLFDLEGAETLATHARLLLAETRYAEGDVAATARALDQAAKSVARSRDPRGVVTAARVRAELAAARGDLPAALASLAEAAPLVARVDADARLSHAGLLSLVQTLSGEFDATVAIARESSEAARREQAWPGRKDLLVRLVECRAFGAPAAVLDAARLAMPGRDSPPDRFWSWAAALLEAMGSAPEAGEAPSLEQAGRLLLDPPFGGRKAYLRALGLRLVARGQEARGDREGAGRARAESREAARRLGHAGLLQEERGGSARAP